MIERWDQQLFLILNSANSPFWDKIMSAVSRIDIWIPLYSVILIYLGIKYKRRFLVLILFIILAVTLSDQSSVYLFKNVFKRLRPCHDPSLQGLVHLINNRCGGLYGFVSSHAANSFNVAFLSLMLVRKKWFSICIILWAAIVGYSRIYLGVHYPGDVLGGALLGAFIGWGVYQLFDLTDRKLLMNTGYFKK